MVSAVAAKRFTEEFATLLDKPVTVTLKSGQRIAGRVVAFNQSRLQPFGLTGRR